MKKISLVLLFCLCTLAGFAQNDKPLNLKEIASGEFIPQEISSVIPIPGDEERYSQMNADKTQIIKYSFKTGKPAEVLFDAATARECPLKKFDSYRLSPDGSKLLIATETTSTYRRSYTVVHYIYSLERDLDGKVNNVAEKLSDGGPQQIPVFSPDGYQVAFVHDNNILLVKLLYGNSESQVTEDGKCNEVLNGTPDWVYEEEFAFNHALEFSPDSKMLVFIRLSEKEMPSHIFLVLTGEAPHMTPYEKYPGEYTYKYPKTNEKNSEVSVHTFDIKSRVIRRINVPLEEGGYIPRIRFTQGPNKLAVMTLNRHQNRFDLYLAGPRGTVYKLAVRDESDTHICESVFDSIIFYPENFSFVSEKSGYNHLYWYSIGGNLIKQVTFGPYEVQNFLGYDPEDDCFYFSSNEESPLRSAIYKTDRKGKKVKLSSQAGTNSAQFNTDMRYFTNRYSNLDISTVIILSDNTGRILTMLVDNAVLKQKLRGYDMSLKEFFSFQTFDGITLNGRMVKPTSFSSSKKYPASMYQYSGPGSQQVLDKSGVSWETYMASQGYVVVYVDGRGTGGRGVEFAKVTYLNLGIKEAKNQVETALYLERQPYVDKDRIGIWGWSHGGYMTIMSMSEGTPVFEAGVAVVPVTDWNYYDTVYGERPVRTPKESAKGYRASSIFTRVNNLHGNLLLVHGMTDDSVHSQNCVEYVKHPVQLDKQFGMQVYTNRNHSIFGGNTCLRLCTKLTSFFSRELKK